MHRLLTHEEEIALAQSRHGRGLMGGILFEDATEDAPFIQAGPHGDGLREIFPEVRWVYRIFGYANVGAHLSVFPGYGYIHVGEHGEWLDDPLNVNFAVFGGEAMQAVAHDVQLAYPLHALTVHDFTVMIPMAFMTLSLLHSRQIETVENIPSGAEARKWRKRTGREMATFKTLRVRPTRREYGTVASAVSVITCASTRYAATGGNTPTLRRCLARSLAGYLSRRTSAANAQNARSVSATR